MLDLRKSWRVQGERLGRVRHTDSASCHNMGTMNVNGQWQTMVVYVYNFHLGILRNHCGGQWTTIEHCFQNRRTMTIMVHGSEYKV